MGWLVPERGTLARDIALAVLSLAGGLLLLAAGLVRTVQPPSHTPTAAFAVPLVVACAAIALRRVATRTSLAAGTVALLADLALGGSLGTILVYTQVLFDACVYGSQRLWRWALRVTVGLSVVAGVVGAVLDGSWRALVLAVPVLLVGVLPVLTGLSVRQYRDQAAAERRRAEQTARLAELDRQQAVTAERTRMARELHDVVANHLSAVALHATAALSVRDTDPEKVGSSLRVIRESGVQGLAEMRRMIDLLREPAGEDAVQVRLAEIDLLVRRAREAGLAVRVRTSGEPRPLPVDVDLAAYRILQESLTNALKHGAGEAEVAVGWAADRIRLTVRNPLPVDGHRAGLPGASGAPPGGALSGVRAGLPGAGLPGAALPGAGLPGAGLPGAALPGAGAGLVGMRERAALLRGHVDAGVDGSWWQVHAELPA